ncbi:beta-1,3-galactosyltransferase 5-like [Phyllobates terribilis]|uniref:beta-1,3-galactosyltransferase 5-like n=1 Tax=Phyllobates terribilis TaxID=111132 RepID=UPI003CCB13D5
MAMRTAWLLWVMLCVLVFTTFLLWGRFLAMMEAGQLLLMFPRVPRRPGVDFSSLSSADLPELACQSDLGLLILVTSHTSHHASRSAIRKTWAQKTKGSIHPWQVVFLVGRPVDVMLDWHMHKEHEIYRDILMGNYVDSYRNLTLKVMHGINWAVERCQPAYILKTDDDCYINTQRLPAFLSKQSPSSQLYVGSIFPEDKRMVIRDPSSKWYVSYGDYESDVYPPYASGIGYILSLDAARMILQKAQTTAPLPVEDAYVGILADRVQIRPLSSARFAKHNAKWSVCNYRYLMVIHGLSPEEQDPTHKKVLSTRTACTHSMEATHWK